MHGVRLALIWFVLGGVAALGCDPPAGAILPPGIQGAPCDADEHVAYCQVGGGVVSCDKGKRQRDPACSCIPGVFFACVD